MQLEVINSHGDLKRLEREWLGLALPSPMQRPAWLVSWWEAFGWNDSTCELATIAVRDAAGRLVGLAPWYLRLKPFIGPTLRFLGDGRAATDHHTILCRSPEDEPAVVSAVARWVAENAGQAWRRVRFEGLDADDRATEQLGRLLTEAGLDAEWVPACGSFLAEMTTPGEPATWDNYLARLSKNRRKRFRRYDRDYFDTGRASVRLARTEADVNELWPLLVSLHRERRVAMGHTGVFDEPEFNHFHQLASRRLLAEGRLHLSLLELDGEPAAIDYSLQDAPNDPLPAVYAYQGGISERGIHEDAGHLSFMRVARTSLETGRTRLDLLRGDEPYKLSWGAVLRPARTLHVRPRDTVGTLERWAGNAYRRLRERSRRNLTPVGQATEAVDD